MPRQGDLSRAAALWSLSDVKISDVMIIIYSLDEVRVALQVGPVVDRIMLPGEVDPDTEDDKELHVSHRRGLMASSLMYALS